MANGTLKVGEITTSTGSGNITIGSGVTLKSNVPAFEAFLSASQSVSNDTTTKIQIDSESYDTDNCYDNSTNYRFTPNVAGKYLIYGLLTFASVSDTTMQLRIHKNGSLLTLSPEKSGTGSASHSSFCSFVDNANGSTDYYELFGFQASGSSKNANGASTQNRTYFGAYRIGA
tara:strand:+ start:454 stop:972 length:519 start_codon:yes stop_codon:yes gene_type:complete